jgi:hypothetical protein
MMLKSLMYDYLMLLMSAIAVIGSLCVGVARRRHRFSSVLTKFSNLDNLKLYLALGQLLMSVLGVSENETLIILPAVTELFTAKTIKLITP